MRRKITQVNERGATIAEFGILAGLVSIAALAAVFALGEGVEEQFSDISANLEDPQPGVVSPAGPPAYDRDQYGVDTAAWLMGSTGADALTLAGEPGVMGLEGDDTISGSSADGEIFIAGPGDDTITDARNSGTFHYAAGDGSDMLTLPNVNRGSSAFILTGLGAGDVSFGISNNGEDLTMTMPDGAVVQVARQHVQNYGIHTATFADAGLNRQGIRDKSVDDQKASGVVLGTYNEENYFHSAGDGSYSIYDRNSYSYQKDDTFEARGINVGDVVLSRDEEDLIWTINGTETITMLNALGNDAYMIPEYTFADTDAMDATDLRSKMVADMKPTGIVEGTRYTENYFHEKGDGRYTVIDATSYSYQQSGTFTFVDTAPEELTLSRDGDDLVAEIPGTSDRITFDGMLNNEARSVEFYSIGGTQWSPRQLRSKMVADMKPTGNVVGSRFAEDYVHRAGDGSYTVYDQTQYGYQQEGSFSFEGISIGDADFSRSGDDLVIFLPQSEETVTMLGLMTWAQRVLPSYYFGGQQFTARDLRSEAVAAQKAAGERANGGALAEDYYHTTGDGSWSLRDWNQYSHQKDDVLHFTDLASTDVIFSADGDDMIITVPGMSEVVRIVQAARYSSMQIPEIKFAIDGVTLNRSAQNARIANGG